MVLWEGSRPAERSTTECAKGDVWEGKIERYFCSRVLAIYELFKLTEKEEGPISDERFAEARGSPRSTATS